ncbi:MAG: DNA repair protein RadC [Opitutus sp.]|nr:DNA repair protein RadC [Opitutus sp.]
MRGFLSDGSSVTFGPLTREEFEAKCAGPNTLETRIYRGVRDLLGSAANRSSIHEHFPKPGVTRRNTGYALDQLLDCAVFDPASDRPFNLCRLMAGSEGTLFLGVEFELTCEPVPPPGALLCAHFATVQEALRATVIAMRHRPSGCELIDRHILDCTKSNLDQAKNRFFVVGDPGAVLVVEIRHDRREEIHGHSVLELASQLIAQAGSIAGLASWQPDDFRRLKGIGRAKGRQLAALIEVGRRMIRQPAGQAPMLNRPELIAAHIAPYARGIHVEKFRVLCLNRKNRLIKQVEVSSGTATAALAHPREVYREAIRQSATGIVCVHNHPSGDPAPGAADLQVTRQLREAAKTVDIELFDHVIVGSAGADPLALGYYSFRSAGQL